MTRDKKMQIQSLISDIKELKKQNDPRARLRIQ